MRYVTASLEDHVGLHHNTRGPSRRVDSGPPEDVLLGRHLGGVGPPTVERIAEKDQRRGILLLQRRQQLLEREHRPERHELVQSHREHVFDGRHHESVGAVVDEGAVSRRRCVAVGESPPDPGKCAMGLSLAGVQ